MLNKLSLILLVTIHEIFLCISLRAKRSNLIVPHAAITDKKYYLLSFLRPAWKCIPNGH